MITQVKSWGNGQGVRFSKELLDSVGIHVDEYIDVQIKDGSIVLSKTFRHKSLEERTLECQGKIGPYDEISWGEAEGREQW
ncbi:MAG: antitoxin MazE [Clostridiales bacterium]|nr:antitoxin MazE [Clostridiales bacterium]